ncbi:MAG: hypothetical protein ABSG76_21260, partial [Xanthobacteraceae bacterium]
MLRRFGLAHQELIVQALHQERHPGEPAFDPDGVETGKPLRQGIENPVGHVHQAAPHEAQRMHADEAVDGRQRGILPMVAGMEGKRLSGVLDRSVE